MSWFLRLAPVVLVCACGGTSITREGDAGAGGKNAAGGEIGNGGAVATGGSGGNRGGVPMNHRPTAIACGVRPPAGDAAPPQGQSPGIQPCMTNPDCKSGPNGRCIVGRIGPHCTYDQCFNDDDCGKGSVCGCSTATSEGSRCLNPGCQVDADCPGSFCSPTFGTCGAYGGVTSYQCHTQNDECLDDSECMSPVPGNCCEPGYCAYDPNLGHWACSYMGCAG